MLRSEESDKNDVSPSVKKKALDSDSDSSSESDSDRENNIPQTTSEPKGVKRLSNDEPSTSRLRPNKIQKV